MNGLEMPYKGVNMGDKLYYMQDTRQFVGNCMLFWAKGGGYTTKLSKAELFTQDEAIEIQQNRGSDKMRDMDAINYISEPMVDMQDVGKGK